MKSSTRSSTKRATTKMPSLGKPPSAKPPTKSPASARRSRCPVACSLDIFGDRWSLLVIRDLFCGRTRFGEMSTSPERVATNILADRLARLCEHGIIEKTIEPAGPKHASYRLTRKGEALRPVLETIRDWGLEWEPGTVAGLKPLEG